MSNWKKVRLGDILNFKRGHDLPKYDMKYGDIPVAGSNGIIGHHNIATHISPCITIGRSGNVGTPYIYEKCWAHNTTLYIDDYKGNNPKYLFYLLKTLNLGNYGGGSAVPTLNRNHIHPIDILYTSDLEKQQRIADILGALDDKIELNNRINRNLEEQAAALFRRWFLDFEFPDSDGNPYRSSGGSFIDSHLGGIPTGWVVGRLDELIQVKYGKDHKKLEDGIIPVYGSGGIMRYVESAIYNKESVLIPRKGTLNNVFYINIPFWSVDTMFYSEMKRPNIAKFIYLLLKSKDLASMNAGSAVPSMTTEILNQIPIVIAPNHIYMQYDKITTSLFDTISRNKTENRSLADLRDTLLPKLMNNEIKTEQTI